MWNAPAAPMLGGWRQDVTDLGHIDAAAQPQQATAATMSMARNRTAAAIQKNPVKHVARPLRCELTTQGAAKSTSTAQGQRRDEFGPARRNQVVDVHLDCSGVGVMRTPCRAARWGS